MIYPLLAIVSNAFCDKSPACKKREREIHLAICEFSEKLVLITNFSSMASDQSCVKFSEKNSMYKQMQFHLKLHFSSIPP